MTHPAKRRHGDVVTTSLCTSQRCRRYVSNETPNDISVERRQDVSVVRLHGVLLVYRDHVSRGRNDDVSSVRLHDVSNETPNDVSVVRHQNVSVVRIHDVPLERHYDVSWNSQMKHPITSLWYVSTTSQSYVVATPCLYYGLYYVSKLLCHGLQLVGFHVSFKHQIKHHVFLVPARREKRGVVWIIS